MRTRALLVHACFCSLSRLLPLEQQVYRLLVSCYGEIAHSLHVHSLLWGLSDLQRLKILSQQIKNLLVVNLHIRTLDSELVCGGFGVLEEVFEQSGENASGLGVNVFVDVG
jgi:hypothetical protein